MFLMVPLVPIPMLLKTKAAIMEVGLLEPGIPKNIMVLETRP